MIVFVVYMMVLVYDDTGKKILKIGFCKG